MITEATIRAELDKIMDPCSVNAGMPAGLDTMGLVRGVETTPNAAGGTDVSIKLAVTEPGCLMLAPFMKEAEQRVCQLSGIGRVEISGDDSGYIWTSDDLSPAYRKRREEVQRQRTRVVAKELFVRSS
jgi:metal-sulfur cluster biosynthetic enzyme